MDTRILITDHNNQAMVCVVRRAYSKTRLLRITYLDSPLSD